MVTTHYAFVDSLVSLATPNIYVDIIIIYAYIVFSI